jgi:ABC-type sugar transport system ATPase subunit
MKQHLVIDPNDEYEGFNRYIVKYADDYDKLKEELKLVVRRLIKPNVRWIERKKNKKKVKKPLHLVVMDEADLYMPSKKTMILRYLYVECRHMQLDLIAITRRLTDINAYPVEVSDYLIVFKQTGYNDLKRLREIGGKEAEEMMREKVDYNKHNFLFFDRDRIPRLINSMDELKEYLPYP